MWELEIRFSKATLVKLQSLSMFAARPHNVPMTTALPAAVAACATTITTIKG